MELFKYWNYTALILGIWLALLSFYIFKTAGHIRKLTRGTNNQNLLTLVEEILEKQTFGEKHLSDVSAKLEDLENKSIGHFQKSALIRFNPFEDSGGDQSFVIALLDGQDNGLVISSLHSRGGTRIYAKSVLGGKAASHQFSKEEKEAVEKACLVARQTARTPAKGSKNQN